MGIKNVPSEYPPESGADCLLCYPAGSAPKYLYANIRGIGRCPFAAPAAPEPLLGMYRLENQGGCRWEFIDHNVEINLQRSAGSSAISFFWVGLPFPIFGQLGSQCQMVFSKNSVNCDTGEYFGGQIDLIDTRKDFQLSIFQNFESDPNAWLDLFNDEAGTYTERIINVKDKSNLLAKLEINE